MHYNKTIDSATTAVLALKPLTGVVAWPTIGLALAVFFGYSAIFATVALGYLPILAGAGINILLGYLVFTPLHEAVHGNIAGQTAKLKWLEKTIGWLAGSLLWAPFPAFQPLHLRHHSHTNDPVEDPDHWVATRHALALLFRSFTLMFVYYFQFLFRSDAQKRQNLPWLILNLTAMFAALVCMGWFFGPAYPLLLWFVPSLCALAILAIVFDWLPHHPHQNRERYQNTRIILLPGIETLLLGQNYHLIHHLYPKLPFYSYGQAFRIVKTWLQKKGAPIYPSQSSSIGIPKAPFEQ